MPTYPHRVVIEEQGLRDGLQPETKLVPTRIKLETIDVRQLAAATRELETFMGKNIFRQNAHPLGTQRHPDHLGVKILVHP
jgi:hypothetical protein